VGRPKGSKTERKIKPTQRVRQLRDKYGLEIEEYECLAIDQNFCCKICGIHQEQCASGHLSVDHDHITGQIRGLLCPRCNSLIGFAQDNTRVLIQAISYLKSSKYRT
jgi:hypothetical protein